MSTLTVGSKSPAVLTHVEFTSSICQGYAQLCNSETVDSLTDEVELEANDAPLKSDCKKGDLVLALFSEDELWYRARVEGIDGESLSVFFVDYGNRETVSSAGVKAVSDELYTKSGLAIKCILPDIMPSNGNAWSSSEKERLENLLINGEFVAEVQGSDPQYGVELRLYSDNLLVANGSPMSSSNRVPTLDLQVGKQYNAYLSYVDSANKFWIQLIDNENELNDLMAGIADCTARGAEQMQNVSTGSLCVANYSEDDAPYRSLILTVNGGQSLVQFIDYGNSESKNVLELKVLPDQYRQLPAQGIKCCYKRTKLNHNTLEDKLQELTSSEGVGVTVLSKSDDVYIVEIEQIESISSGSHSGSSQVGTNASHKFSHIDLQSNIVYDVCVSHVEHPGKFFIQLLENGPELDQLMVKLTQEYNTANTQICEESSCCIAQLSDNQHYRCIVKRTSVNTATVVTVDFGFEENVDLKKLKLLPQKLQSYQAYAVECTVDITKTQEKFWSDNETNIMKAFESKVPLVAKVTSKRGNVCQVDLYDTRDREEDRYINAEMLGVGKSAAKAATIKMESRLSSHSTQDATLTVIPPAEILLGNQELVCVNAIKESNLFYAQLTKTDVQKIADLQQRLNEVYEAMGSSEMMLVNPRIGSYCCSRYVDGGWYRGLIVSKTGNSVEVEFVDFGDGDVKTSGELKQLLPEFTVLSQQCVLCHFPKVLPSCTKENMESLLLNKVIQVKMVSKKDGVFPTYVVELTSHLNNQGLSAQLLGSPQSLKQPPRLPKSTMISDVSKPRFKIMPGTDGGYKTLQISIGISDEVMVTHVADPDHFHVQLVTLAKQLDKMMDKLHNHYSALKPGEEDLKDAYLGAPCVAKYSDDENWYRAKVIGFMHDGRIEVLFVDYGNTEVLYPDTGNLKMARADLVEDSPAQAILCGLSGVEPVQGFWSPEHSVQFEDIVLDQNFTANFHLCKADGEYMVTLYNKEGMDINSKFGNSTNSVKIVQTDSGSGRGVSSGSGIDLRVKINSSNNAGNAQNEWMDEGGNVEGNNRNFSRRASGDKPGSGRFGDGGDAGGFGSKGGGFSGGRRGFGDDNGRGMAGGSDYSSSFGGGRRNFGEKEQSGGFGEKKFGDRDGESGGFGGRSRDGGGFGGRSRDENSGSGFGGRSRDGDSEGFGGRSRDGGFGGRSRDDDSGRREGSGGFGGRSRDGDGGGFGGRSRDSGFSGRSRDDDGGRREGGSGFGGRSRDGESGGFGGRPRDSGFSGRSRDDDGGNGFGGRREGGSGFGGRSRDNDNGSFGGRSRDGSGFSSRESSGGFGGRSRDDDGGGGFGGRREGNRGFGGRSRDDDTGGFGGRSRDGCGFGGRRDGSGGFGGRSRDTDDGVFGGRSRNNDSGGFRGGFGVRKDDDGGGGGRPGRFGDRQRDDSGGFGGNRDGGFGGRREGGFGGGRRNDDSGSRGGFGGDRGGSDRGFGGGRSSGGFGSGGNTSGGFGKSSGGFGGNQKPSASEDDWESESIQQISEQVTAPTQKSRFRGVSGSSNSSSSQVPGSDKELATEDMWQHDSCGDFTFQKLKADSSCSVYVVFSKSPSEFWCQLVEKSEEVQSLMDNMNEKYSALSGNKLSIETHEIGMPCVAKFSEDGLWYRAEVVSFTDTEVEVQFVDYGNSEIVDLGSVKKATKEVMKMPAQGIRCSLNGIKAKDQTWSEQSKEEFDTLTSDKELLCTMKSYVGGSYVVNLEDSTGEMDVALKLHEAGHCTLAAASPDKAKETIVKNPYPVIPVTLKSSMEVYISWIDNPMQFWVQPVDMQNTLDQLVEQIQTEYTSGPGAGKKVSKVAVGMAVIALFSDDGAWYRAVIEREGREIGVRFVDYGNQDSLTIDKLRLPTEEIMEVPSQAIYCSLADIKPLQPGSWNVDAKDIMEGLVKESAQCTFKKEIKAGFSVDLNVDGISVAEELISAAVVKKVGASPRKADSSKSLSDVSAATQRLDFPDRVSMVLGTSEAAYITQVDSVSSFYCQLAKYSDQLESLMEVLESACEQKLPPATLSNEMACAAKFSLDNMWYRARIIQIAANAAEVQFVDYGNSEKVEIENIREIVPECLALPPQAIHCRLSRDFSGEEVVKKLRDLTADNELQVKLVEDSSLPRVDIFIGGQSVADLLQSVSPTTISPASPSKISLPKQQIQLGEDVKAYVSSVQSPSKFFLQLASQEDLLNELTTNLQTYYSSENSPVPKVEYGMLCCAKFSEDDTWYRACVEKITGEKCQVLFIDYGNSEEVDCNTLVALSSDFTTHSALAYACCLADIIPIDGTWSSDAMSCFEEATMDQELTCKFVTRKTVKLFNQEGDVAQSLVESKFAVVMDATAVAELKFDSQHMPSSQVSAFVSSVEDIFYLHLSDDENMLMELSENLQEICSELMSPTAQQVQQGTHCCAKFSEDKEWYRAEVVQVLDSTITVRFVDYGNCEEISLHDLKTLKTELCSPAPLAYACMIKDVGKLNSEQQAVFSHLTEDQTLDVTFFEMVDGVFIVQIKTSDGNDIGQNKLTVETTAYKSFITMDDDGCSLSADQQDSEIKQFASGISSSTVGNEGVLSHIVLVEGDRIQVTTSHVNSPSQFYLHLDSNKAQLDALLDKMFEFYSNLTDNSLDIDTPTVGCVCAAKFSEDESWYRAKVIEAVEDRYTVEFIDHGNSEVTNLSSLKKLVSSFAELPVQGLECTLAGVRATEGPWTEEAVELFTELATEKNLLADIVCVSSDNSYIVQLLDMGVSVSQKFLEAGHGIESETPVVSKKVKRVFSDSSDASTPVPQIQLHGGKGMLEKVYEGIGYNTLTLHQKESYTCVISHAENPGHFYCQLANQIDELQIFMDNLQEKYNTESPTLEEDQLVKGTPCVALYSEDGQYYRAEVLLKSEDGTVLVLFVDYGNSESVPLAEVKKVQNEDTTLPRQAFRCSMAGIKPDSESDTWDEQACGRFDELTFEKELTLKISKVLHCDKYSVILEDKDLSLSQSLVDGGYAKFVTNEDHTSDDQSGQDSFDSKDDFQSVKSEDASSESDDVGIMRRIKLLEDTEYDANISDVIDPSHFSVQLIDNIVLLEEIESSIAEYIKSKEEDLLPEEDIHAEAVCLALSTDEEWYRARILAVNEEEVEILYMDYGNTEIVEKSGLRNVPNSLKKHPPQSVTCGLFDVLPRQNESTWSEECIQFFKEFADVHSHVSMYIEKICEDGRYLVCATPIGSENKDSANHQLTDLGFADPAKGSTLEAELHMQDTENSFAELSMHRENSYGSIDDETDVDASKLTFDGSVLETTSSDSFSFINLKQMESSPEGQIPKEEDEDDEFFDAAEEDRGSRAESIASEIQQKDGSPDGNSDENKEVVQEEMLTKDTKKPVISVSGGNTQVTEVRDENLEENLECKDSDDRQEDEERLVISTEVLDELVKEEVKEMVDFDKIKSTTDSIEKESDGKRDDSSDENYEDTTLDSEEKEVVESDEEIPPREEIDEENVAKCNASNDEIFEGVGMEDKDSSEGVSKDNSRNEFIEDVKVEVAVKKKMDETGQEESSRREDDEETLDKKDEVVAIKDEETVDRTDVTLDKEDEEIVKKKDDKAVDKKIEETVVKDDEETVDRTGKETLDKEDEEIVEKKDKAVDKTNEETVVKDDEETVDRMGKETLDKEDEEIVEKKDKAVDKTNEETVVKDDEETVDRTGKETLDKEDSLVDKSDTERETVSENIQESDGLESQACVQKSDDDKSQETVRSVKTDAERKEDGVSDKVDKDTHPEEDHSAEQNPDESDDAEAESDVSEIFHQDCGVEE